jgi:hypothetical protein
MQFRLGGCASGRRGIRYLTNPRRVERGTDKTKERKRGVVVGWTAADLVRVLLQCVCPLRQNGADAICVDYAQLEQIAHRCCSELDGQGGEIYGAVLVLIVEAGCRELEQGTEI